MTRSGINLESIKVKNRQVILKLLNNKGAMSRKDIALNVHLTSASVTQLCSEMIDEGIIVELGEVSETGKVGRKKILVDINYESRKICSVTIEKYTTSIAITNLKGQVIDHLNIETNNQIPPKIFLKHVSEKCLELANKHGIDMEDLLGIGVSARGIVDGKSGVNIEAYNIWDEPVPIKEIIESYLSVNVVVENNMKAFAQGEIIYGLGKKYQKLLFLKWYPGVGSAIVIDGEVYEGRNNKVAEIGHYIIEPNGERCKCGRLGCLETMASYASMIDRITRVYSQVDTPILYRQTAGDKKQIHVSVLDYIEGRTLEIDSYVMEIIYKATDRVARSVVNAITMLSPDKVVIYGEMFENEEIIQNFLECCYKYDKTYDQEYILKSELSNKYSYIGGTAIVINKLFFALGGYISD